jgi:type IV secretory pathway VirB6-like protein
MFKKFQSAASLPTGNHLCIALLALVAFIFLAAIPDYSLAAGGEDVVCAKDITPASTANPAAPITSGPGYTIVKAVFDAVNTLLSKMGSVMYTKLVQNASFQTVIGVLMGLYVSVYGVMILFNIAPHSVAEITSRLIRLSIFYGLVSYGGGMLMFDKYFVTFFMGGMNQLIVMFMNAVNGTALTVTPLVAPVAGALQPAMLLNTNVVSALFGPMNEVFKPFFLVSILGLLFCGMVGWCFAIAMAYAFVEFCKMAFGAIVTYIRSIVGLTFLFGVAPIFISFLLFEQTRVIFRGWVNQVASFAIAPIMLFTFLSFYTILLTSVLNQMFVDVNFCWLNWFSISGTPVDVGWWRPVKRELIEGVLQWVPYAGDWTTKTGVPLPPPINIINIIFFLVLCHLGKIFCQYVVQIAGDISGGIGGSSEGMMGTMGGFMEGGGGGTGASGLGAAFSGSSRFAGSGAGTNAGRGYTGAGSAQMATNVGGRSGSQ